MTGEKMLKKFKGFVVEVDTGHVPQKGVTIQKMIPLYYAEKAIIEARQDTVEKIGEIIKEFESMKPPHIINHTVNVNPHYTFMCDSCGWDWGTDEILDKDPDMKCACGVVLRRTLRERKTHDQEVRQYIPIKELKIKIEKLEKEM